jgi:hypothetical protein
MEKVETHHMKYFGGVGGWVFQKKINVSTD